MKEPNEKRDTVEAEVDDERDRSAPQTNRNISRAFWGTIFVIAGATLLLTAVAALRSQDRSIVETSGPPVSTGDSTYESGPTPEPKLVEPTEIPRVFLESMLGKAPKEAINTTLPKIEPLLEEAYAPVYASIPKYAEFHYSIRGQYTELGQAALNELGSNIHNQLFEGMDQRLAAVAATLDNSFETAYRDALNYELKAIQQSSEAPLPENSLTEVIIADASRRVMYTAPIASTAIAATGVASLKLASKAIAKKLSIKIAAKIASQGAAKGGGTLAGAASGGFLCSWAGPGAIICAAVGGGITWLAVDVAIIQLDEVWNRDEFESELKQLVDQDRKSRKQMLERAVQSRAIGVDEKSKVLLSDFTLRQLPSGDFDTVCDTSVELQRRYSVVQESLKARAPEKIEALKDSLNEFQDHDVLAPLVMEIELNLPMHPPGWINVSDIEIRGNLPAEYRHNRDVSGRILTEGQVVEFEREDATEEFGFTLSSSESLVINGAKPFNVQVVLEQHRRIWPNRLFGGLLQKSSDEIFEAISDSDGLQQPMRLPVALVQEEDAHSIEDVDARSAAGDDIVMNFTIVGERLADLENTPSCSDY